jgi:hypothetical protein
MFLSVILPMLALPFIAVPIDAHPLSLAALALKGEAKDIVQILARSTPGANGQPPANGQTNGQPPTNGQPQTNGNLEYTTSGAIRAGVLRYGDRHLDTTTKGMALDQIFTSTTSRQQALVREAGEEMFLHRLRNLVVEFTTTMRQELRLCLASGHIQMDNPSNLRGHLAFRWNIVAYYGHNSEERKATYLQEIWIFLSPGARSTNAREQDIIASLCGQARELDHLLEIMLKFYERNGLTMNSSTANNFRD